MLLKLEISTNLSPFRTALIPYSVVAVPVSHKNGTNKCIWDGMLEPTVEIHSAVAANIAHSPETRSGQRQVVASTQFSCFYTVRWLFSVETEHFFCFYSHHSVLNMHSRIQRRASRRNSVAGPFVFSVGIFISFGRITIRCFFILSLCGFFVWLSYRSCGGSSWMFNRYSRGERWRGEIKLSKYFCLNLTFRIRSTAPKITSRRNGRRAKYPFFAVARRFIIVIISIHRVHRTCVHGTHTAATKKWMNSPEWKKYTSRIFNML